ncbi:MAG: universal stress protein [Chitinophagaceae bacterium]
MAIIVYLVVFVDIRTKHFMDNIILVIEGSSINIDLVRFACYIGELNSSEITAAFIKDTISAETSIENQTDSLRFDEKMAFRKSGEDEDNDRTLDRNVEILKEECSKKGIKIRLTFKTYKELIDESRFADLIIADPRFRREEEIPSRQTRNILELSECPVLLAPEHYTEITEIVHCYDGSRGSVFAIKLFTYLFPNLLDLRCILLQVDKEPEWNVENQKEMQRWLKGHYSQAAFNVVQGNVEEQLYNYLEERQGSLVTMGAYGRSSVSLMLKESHANGLLRSLNNPIFISHS